MELKGKTVADSLGEQLKARAFACKEKGVTPCLAILIVGSKPDDMYYASAAIKKAQSLGVDTKFVTMAADTSQEDVLKELDILSNDDSVSGILPLMPMPRHIDPEAVRAHINPKKDADCLTDQGYADLFTQKKGAKAPCTPAAVMEILNFYNIPVSGKRAVIIGRSLVVGKPLAMLLLAQNATVTVCHSRTENLARVCREADILIAAIGKAKFVTREFVKESATVIDVGINNDENGNMCGDVDFNDVKDIAGNITPVPGGVGSVTTSVLIRNVIESAESTL
ncbi:MAG: bifunctional 5,10-methylene-tetrahydrofolate dehydrogenase/5,10-methylene-tetrahydrofolate cyclohydrolase [Clostridiales bacterium]|nr:bifunctional 5,10-methylene-tetrahydrofolate dehydrogenase/5,10-methylene-tetrahydrofolate cyclohydrolase [Clostridiales bacterium]